MKKGAVVTIAVLVVLVLGGVGVWYFALRSDAPEEFTIDSTAPTGGSTAATAPLAGQWVVGRSPDGKPSEVGYRVSERFAGGAIDVDAVGRTSQVAGRLTVDGTKVSATTVTANLNALKSDRSQRDNKLRSSGLETDRFPEATFTLTQPIEVPGGTGVLETTAVGTLTLHGVTQPVSVGVEATRAGAGITVVGSAPVAMADFGITPPSISGFVTVADRGTFEMQLFFVQP
jgi:polyisoprenoid-binding protein YceI